MKLSEFYYDIHFHSKKKQKTRGRCGRDRMVVEFTTTYAISAYQYLSCEFESHSWRGEVWQVGSFLRLVRLHRFPPPIKLTAAI